MNKRINTLASALRTWALQAVGRVLPEGTAGGQIVTLDISSLPRHCFRGRQARTIRGSISFPAADRHKLRNLRIGFHGEQDPATLTGVAIRLQSMPELFLDISHSGQTVTIGPGCSGRWVFHLWGRCSASIGQGSSATAADCFINPGGTLQVGDDCMLANVFLHVGDNHTIFDLQTGQKLNHSDTPSIVLGPHVWLASRVTVLADSDIGAGSVVGVGSVIKGSFGRCSLAAGVPARTLREGISWTRSQNGTGAWEVVKALAAAGAMDAAQGSVNTPPDEADHLGDAPTGWG